jgi:hypothetical protein
MRSWRQPHNQKARRDVAEGRNRFAPVIPGKKCASLRCRDFAAMAEEAGAAVTGDDLAIQYEVLRYKVVRQAAIHGDRVSGAGFGRLLDREAGH